MQTQGTARLSGSSSASTPTTQLATLVIVNGRTTPCGCLRRTSRWAGAFCGTLARRHLSGRRLSFCLVGQITVAAWHLLRRRRPRHLLILHLHRRPRAHCQPMSSGFHKIHRHHLRPRHLQLARVTTRYLATCGPNPHPRRCSKKPANKQKARALMMPSAMK